MTSLKHRLPADLRTERLVLTAPTMAHAPAIARHCNNHAVHQWMSRLPFPYSEEDARFFVEEIVPGDDELCYALLVNDELVGVIGLSFAQGEDPVLGYWLGEPHWGNGYASEAGRAVVAAARTAGIAALASRALSHNTRSLHVLGKLGFMETHKGPEPIGPHAGTEATFVRLDLSR